MFQVLPFFLFFVCVSILPCNKFSLLLLLLALLGLIAPVFNIFSHDHFLQKPCRGLASHAPGCP